MKGDIKIKTETNKLTEYCEGQVSFGKVVQDNPAGCDNNFESAGGERVVEESSTTSLPTYNPSDVKAGMIGVHVYKFIPSLGGLLGAARLQLAIKELFSDVVGNAYAATDVSEADLIKLQLWSESLLMLILEVDRALYVYNKIDPINKLTGKLLLESLGFSYSEISSYKQNFIDVRNQIADVINKNLYLAHNGRIDKIMYLLGRIFTGDVTRKTDLAVFVPVEYKVEDSTEFNLQLDWDAWQANDSDVAPKRITLQYLNDVFDNLSNLVLSSWFNEVAPYLFHVYGDDKKNLMKLDHFKDISEFAYTYNPYVNEALRNGKQIGTIRGDSDGLLRCMIYEDSDGMIRQGGELTASGDRAFRIVPDVKDSPTGSGTVYYRTVMATGDIVTNSEDYEANDDVLQSILALNYMDKAYFDGNSYPAQDTVVTYSGPIYILNHLVNYVTDDVSGTTYIQDNDEYGNVPQYVWLNGATGSSREIRSFNSRSVTCNTTADIMDASFGRPSDWYKSQISMYRTIILYGSVTPGKTLYPEFKDIDNCFLIPRITVKNFYIASTYALAMVDAPNWSRQSKK